MTKDIRVKRNTTLESFQKAIDDIYGIQDDRLYSVWDILSNQERFSMRALKGIRKNDMKKLKTNLVISVAWLMALMNRFHIDFAQAVRVRFPYLCSYCGGCPCVCRNVRPKRRTRKKSAKVRNVKTLSDFQKMFSEIYPPRARSLDHTGVHMAEEQGEISESVHTFLGEHRRAQLTAIAEEAADFFSCALGVANASGIDFARECSRLFRKNCHRCHKAPCGCSFSDVAAFVS